jgi:2-keto-3-deoxy-6-phosphogluconate aldolase
MLVRLLPFLLAIGVGLAVISNVRGAVWISLAGSALIALFALVDASRSGGLAAIELAIAVSSALVALAALSGRYRAVPRTAAGTVADDHPAQ